MREFGIAFEKGLRKGLRAFRNAPSGDEELVECYNLMPGELGLVPHEFITGMDAPVIVPPALLDIIAYWNLDETVGPYNEAIHNNDMLVLTDFNTNVMSSEDGISEKCARALQVQLQQGRGSEGGYVPNASVFDLSAISWTINFWFKYAPDYPGFGYYVLRKATYDVASSWSSPTGREWAVYLQGTSEGTPAFIFQRGNGTGWPQEVVRTIPERDDEWYMVTIMYDLPTTALTISVSTETDGFNARTITSTGFNPLTFTTSPIVLGNFMNTAEGDTSFDYDEIGIWGGVLSSDVREEFLWNDGDGNTFPFV